MTDVGHIGQIGIPSSWLEKTDRNAEWCRLYEGGMSCGAIADRYGVTRERVCQILRKANLIEHKQQRRRLAAELVEEDRAAVKAAKEAIEARLIAFVQGGMSIAGAAVEVGLNAPQATYICKRRGIISQHGRWHDFSGRKARFVELIESGLSVSKALEALSSEEGRKVSYVWAWRNFPELMKKHTRKINPMPVIPAPTPAQIIKALASPKPEKVVQVFDWTEEKIAELIRLWFSGVSSQQVVDIFGSNCTRNAVLGQLHRLRLAGRLKPSSL